MNYRLRMHKKGTLTFMRICFVKIRITCKQNGDFESNMVNELYYKNL